LPVESTEASAEKAEMAAEDPAGEAKDLPLVEGGEPAEAAEAASAVPMEEVEIDVWWPKDTGPFRRERQKPEARPRQRHKRTDRPDRKPEQNENAGSPPAKAAKPQRPPRPERRAEKPIDPDSPFAVLGALKAQLAKKT
jgi:ATP-dependent RNA helicase SUPV3L1/SUV3